MLGKLPPDSPWQLLILAEAQRAQRAQSFFRWGKMLCGLRASARNIFSGFFQGLEKL